MSLGDSMNLVKALSQQLAQSSVEHDSYVEIANDMFYLIPDSTLQIRDCHPLVTES